MTHDIDLSQEDLYTFETHAVLNTRFGHSLEGIYYAHQPIYGFRTPYASPSSISRYMVTKSIVNALNKYNFSTFIDIGGAEGYTANIVRSLFEVMVKSTDLSENACKMAEAIFGIEAVPCDIHHLPFEEGSFDAVLCSETIEHVTDYQQAIRELLRITRKVLVITVPHETPQMVAQNIRNKVPHGHIHYFDTHTLDYLRDEGYNITYEKTLSPILTIPRVMVEGAKKLRSELPYKLYNAVTPILKNVFGLWSANQLVDWDTPLAKTLGAYGGITFTITRKPVRKKRFPSHITAKAFTDIQVPPFLIENVP